MKKIAQTMPAITAGKMRPGNILASSALPKNITRKYMKGTFSYIFQSPVKLTSEQFGSSVAATFLSKS
jgi:hypothetical protein